MNTQTNRRVTAAEINELLAFERRLRHRGENATCAEWVAYFEAKADLFDRIATDPLSLADAAAAREVAATARAQAELVRAEAADWRWV
jgi:hypothetical protein